MDGDFLHTCTKRKRKGKPKLKKKKNPRLKRHFTEKSIKWRKRKVAGKQK
jgi:hypothetical protein